MPDFTSTQAQLAAARTNQDAAQLAALEAAARSRQAQSALDLATRQTSSARGQNEKLSQLAAAAKQASADQAAANQALSQAEWARPSLIGGEAVGIFRDILACLLK